MLRRHVLWKLSLVGLLVALFLLLAPPTTTSVEAASGARVVLTIYSIEALDELEGWGDQADFGIIVWVDNEVVMQRGPFDGMDYVIVNGDYPFYCSGSTFDLEMHVYEVDVFDNDEADISGASGRGYDDYTIPSRGAKFIVTYDVSTGELTGDPYEVDGEWLVTSGELDGSTGSDENDAEVYFKIEVNREPILEGQSPSGDKVTIEEGQDLEFSVDVTDAEGDELDYVWYIDDKEHLDRGDEFGVTTPTGSAGTYIISCDVYEGNNEFPVITVAWELIVNEFNFPPKALLEGPTSGEVFETLVFSGTYSFDPDDTDIYYEWSIDGDYASDLVDLHTLFLESGVHTVELTVSDDEKSSTATLEVTISDTTMPEAIMEIVNRGTGTLTTDYEYLLRSTQSWSIQITECDSYGYFLTLGLWYEYRMEHEGTAEAYYLVVDGTSGDFDLQTMLEASEDLYSVDFKPTLFVQIEKRYYDGRTTEFPIQAPMPLPTMEDIDGDGTNVGIGGYTIYLWDSWVEIYSQDGTDTFGDVFEYNYTATLASINILELVKSLDPIVPGISFVASILDLFIDVELEFNLNVDIWFSEDLVYFRDMKILEHCSVLNFYEPEETTVDSVNGLNQGDTVYSGVYSYMDADVYGSVDLSVTFDFSSIIQDFINFLFGTDIKEFSFNLLEGETISGSTESFTLTEHAFTVRQAELTEPSPIVQAAGRENVSLEWIKSSDVIAEEYRVYVVADQPPVVGVHNPMAIVTAPDYQVVLENLEPGTEYWVVVEAIGVDDSSKVSNPISFRTEEEETSGGLGGTSVIIGGIIAGVLVVVVVMFYVLGRKRKTSPIDEMGTGDMPISSIATIPSDDPIVDEGVDEEDEGLPAGSAQEIPKEPLRKPLEPETRDATSSVAPKEDSTPKPAFCPECGTRYKADGKFCEGCGYKRDG